MKKPSIYLIAALSAVSITSFLTGCSTPKPLVEPYMAPMESELSLDKNWQVKLNELPNLDTRGIGFAENQQQLFIGTETGDLAALIKNNKSRWVDQVSWQVKLDSAIVSGPALNQQQLFVGTSKGQLIAMSAEDGAYLWQKQLSSEVVSRAVFAEGKIFTRTVDGKLYALDASNGKEIWAIQQQMPSLSLRGSPAVLYVDGVLFVGWETGSIQAVSAKSGERLWETRIAVPSGRTDLERMVDVQASLVYRDGYLYALGYHGRLAAINPNNGNFFFIKELSGYRDFVVDDSGLYVVDENDVLYGFDRISGAQLWKQESFKNRLIGDLALFDDRLMVVDSWGYLHWMNKLQGVEIARAKHSNYYGDGNRIQRVLVEQNKTYLLDDEGVITSYDIVPSNLALFRQQHNEKLAAQTTQDTAEKTEETKAQQSDSGFKFSDLWPF